VTDFLDALERQLVDAAKRGVRRASAPSASASSASASSASASSASARHAGAPTSATRPPRATHRRQRGRKNRHGLLILIPALLVLAVAGLALGGVIEIGEPASHELSAAEAGYGPLTPGTVRLLPIRTPDPSGGPPWGLRVFSTKRGVGCIQVGRLVDGRLGALGQDGAFEDDGRFHEIPAGDALRFFACSALDGNGRVFNNVTIGDEPASAWSGAGRAATRSRPATPGSCVPATATPAEKAPRLGVPVSICPQADERNLYFGLLGPDAESITYTSGEQRRTAATVGPEGAYLIVTRASPDQLFNFSAGGTSDVVPVDGPITEIHYRNGSTCHLTARSWMGGASACTPTLQVPVGYRTVKTPTAAEMATPVHATVQPNDRGENEILVSFTSPISITEYRSEYSVELDESPLQPRAVALNRADANSNFAAGQTVTIHIRGTHGVLPAGTYSGTVRLISATGPVLFEGPGTVYVPVGSFSAQVP
jgi:hypothetical protein